MPPIEQFAEFAGNHVLLTTGLIGSLMLLIFTEIQRKTRALTDVPPQTAVALMNNDAKVIDVRSAERFKAGHLVGAENLDASALAPDSAKLKALAGKPVLIVCDNGINSGKLAASLRKAGAETVFSLKGGLAAWRQENLPLIAPRKEKLSKAERKKSKSAQKSS